MGRFGVVGDAKSCAPVRLGNAFDGCWVDGRQVSQLLCFLQAAAEAGENLRLRVGRVAGQVFVACISDPGAPGTMTSVQLLGKFLCCLSKVHTY